MMIHEITEKVGRYKSRKRIGRGEGSGQGGTDRDRRQQRDTDPEQPECEPDESKQWTALGDLYEQGPAEQGSPPTAAPG